MLQEEEPESVRVVPQWPPTGHAISRPQGFMGKICTGKGPGGRPVEWPPRPEPGDNQDQPDQVASSAHIDQVAPPVPPRPANYPQANSMEQVQQQQQVMSQQHQQQQRQQQQQVTSSSEMRTVKQSYQVKQHYEQRSTGSHQQTEAAVRFQQPQQQSLQFQQFQQTSSTSASSQHPPVFSKQMATPPASSGQAGPPFSQGGPAHQSNFPQHNATQNAAPPQYAPQPQYAPHNRAQPQYAPQNVAQPQYVPQNVAQPQYAPQNVAQPQYAPQNVAQPQYAPQNVAQPQQTNQQTQPQYSSQNAAQPQKGPQSQPQKGPQIQPQKGPQSQPQKGPQIQPQKGPQSQPQKGPQSQPHYVPVTVVRGHTNTPPPKPDVEFPPGYSTAYSAVHGEWPPKINNAPNLTTTYPSGFKYKEQAPLDNVPAKVVMSQPAFKISQPIRRRGDDKWPPKTGGEPTQNEVREFIKPKKMNKNYGEFFAQNALPHNYAGYRPPPGTQHRGVDDDEDEEDAPDGVSNM